MAVPKKRDEADKVRDALRNGRDRREEIAAEWAELGLEPRVQSPGELRRVLMTWTKADLVEKVIRADSDEMKALREQRDAVQHAHHLRAGVLVLPADGRRFTARVRDPWDVWLEQHRGTSPLAKDVFMDGWRAAMRASEAMSADARTELRGLLDSLDDAVISDDDERGAVYDAILRVFEDLAPAKSNDEEG